MDCELESCNRRVFVIPSTYNNIGGVLRCRVVIDSVILIIGMSLGRCWANLKQGKSRENRNKTETNCSFCSLKICGT